jgi:hypothetical protein
MNCSFEREKSLRDILRRVDPLGVDARTDEYDVISRIVAAGLTDVQSVSGLEELLNQSFAMWVEEESPALCRDYAEIANNFWDPEQDRRPESRLNT